MKKLVLLFISITLLSYYACQDSTDLDPKTPPVAKFTYSPSNIDTSTVVTFDASLSTDSEDPITALKFEWDFEGSQNWSPSSKSTTASYKYSLPGTYEAALRVIDTEGWSHETSLSVIVLDSIN